MNNNTVVLTTLLNGEQAAKELENLRVKAKSLAMTIDDAEKKGNYAFAKQMKRDLTDTNREINKLQRQTTDVNHILKNLSTAKPKELRQAFQALSRQLDNKSIQRNSRQWDEINSKMKLVRAEMQKVRMESQVAEGFFSRFANGFNKYFASIMSFVGMITGASLTFRKLSQDAAKMEDTYADVMKTTGLTREAVGDLNEEFKKMDTRTAREELNNLARDAGKLGLSSKKDVLDFVEAGNQINVALGEDLGEGAIRNIGKMSEVFRNSTRELDQMDLKGRMLSIGSAINELGQSSTASEAYLVNFTQRLGGVASQANISIQNVLGYASALDQSGQAVEMSATAIQKFIMNLMGEPAKFARIAGLEVEEFSKLLKEDTNEAIKTVLRSLSEKGGFQQLIPIFKEMGLDGARAVGVLSALATNIDKVDEAQQISNKAFSEAISLTNEYNVKNENANAELEKRRKAFKDASEELGRRLNPALLKSTSYLTYLVKILPSLLDFMLRFGKMIFYMATAYAAYTVSIKAHTYWQKVTLGLSRKELIEYYKSELALKRKAAATYIARVAVLAYNATIALFTGNITRARAAMKLLTATMATNPIGWIGIAATIAVAGIVKLVKWLTRTSEATKAIREATKEFNSELASEKKEVDALFSAYKKANPETDAHLSLRKKIISTYGKYLEGLIDEKGNITDIEEAQKRVNNAIREQIALKVRNAATSKIMEESLDAQTKITEKMMKRIAKQVPSEVVRSAIHETINRTVSDFEATGSKDYAALQQSLLQEIQQNYGVDAYKGVWSIKNTVTSLVKELGKSANAIENVKTKYSGMISELTEVSSILGNKENEDEDEDEKNKKDIISAIDGNPLKEREEALKNSYQRQILDLKNLLLDRKITEDEYQREAYTLLINHLFEMMRARKDFGADTLDLETQLTDKMLDEANRRYKLIADIEKKQADDIKKRSREEAVDEDFSPQNYRDEKLLLDLQLKYEHITEEAHQEAMFKLKKEYLDKYIGESAEAAQVISDITADMFHAFDSFQRAEEMSVERKYNKMIQAAGKNSQKATQLEEEKEAALQKVRAKYADKQFVITIANVISSTALAAIEAYAAALKIPGVGLVLAPIAAGAASLYGAGQIAIAKQQRDAAKQGYADGGYTRKGDWWEADGVVHKNEFVGNRYAVANPAVRKVFDVVDLAQRQNTIGSLTERDFQTALNYNEYTQRRIMSDALSGIVQPSQPADQSSGMIAILAQLAAVNSKLTQQLDEPIVAETYIEGKGGSKQANDYYSKMKKNVSR